MKRSKNGNDCRFSRSLGLSIVKNIKTTNGEKRIRHENSNNSSSQPQHEKQEINIEPPSTPDFNTSSSIFSFSRKQQLTHNQAQGSSFPPKDEGKLGTVNSFQSKFWHLLRMKEENLFPSLNREKIVLSPESVVTLQRLLETPGRLSTMLSSDEDLCVNIQKRDHGIHFRSAKEIRDQLLFLNNKLGEQEGQYPFAGHNFSDVVDFLRQRKLLSEDVSNPDITNCETILGLESSDIPLTSRRDQLDNAMLFCLDSLRSFEYSCRKPSAVFVGMSGSGKTRHLFEVAKILGRKFEDEKKVLPLAVTFDSLTPLCETDLNLLRKDEHFSYCISLRLMYSYLYFSKEISFNDFSKKILIVFKNNDIPLSFLDLSTVLSYFEEIFPNHRLLLLVDETLRPLTPKHASPNFLHSMMHKIIQACDPPGRAVLFSAYSADFLPKDISASSRVICPLSLPLLSISGSEELIWNISREIRMRTPFDSLLRSSGLTREEVIRSLASLGIVSLPRFAEFLCRALSEHLESFPQLICRVKQLVQEHYQSVVQSWPLIFAAIQGLELRMEDLIPGSDKTFRDCIYNGLVLDPPTSKNPHLRVSLPPFLIMCSSGPTGPEVSPIVSAVYSDLTNLMESPPRNLWEEFCFRLLILKSYLFPHSIDSSPLSMFGSEIGISTPSFLQNVKVDLSKPFERVLLTFDTPPSPEFLSKHPELADHLWTPFSLQESGIDCLTFLRITDPSSEIRQFVCLGLQCKYSDVKAKVILSVKDVKKAQRNFLWRMRRAGWVEEQCGLVFLTHGYSTLDLPFPLSLQKGGGVSLIGSGCGVEEWLGECMLSYIRGLHHQAISHHPRMHIYDKIKT